MSGEKMWIQITIYFVATIMPGGCYLFQNFLNNCKQDNTDFAEISMRGLLLVIDASHERKDSLHESVSS